LNSCSAVRNLVLQVYLFDKEFSEFNYQIWKKCIIFVRAEHTYQKIQTKPRFSRSLIFLNTDKNVIAWLVNAMVLVFNWSFTRYYRKASMIESSRFITCDECAKKMITTWTISLCLNIPCEVAKMISVLVNSNEFFLHNPCSSVTDF
jgi:hypothetical protein